MHNQLGRSESGPSVGIRYSLVYWADSGVYSEIILWRRATWVRKERLESACCWYIAATHQYRTLRLISTPVTSPTDPDPLAPHHVIQVTQQPHRSVMPIVMLTFLESHFILTYKA